MLACLLLENGELLMPIGKRTWGAIGGPCGRARCSNAPWTCGSTRPGWFARRSSPTT